MGRTDTTELRAPSHGRSQGVAGLALQDRLLSFFQGTIVEGFDALVTSDGATITLSVAKTGGGPLTLQFSTGDIQFPASSITLAPGTEALPAKYYVYILTSTLQLTTNPTDWPTGVQHARIGIFAVQTAAIVQTRGAILTQNFNDEMANADDLMGHLPDITLRARRVGGGVHLSGTQGSAVQDGPDLWVEVTAGLITQMHPHAWAAFNSDTGGASDLILVANQFGANFDPINSLNELDFDALGNALGNNKYLKVVVGGAANKEGEYQPVWLKLPSGTENTAAAADLDLRGLADFEYPSIFDDTTTPFLIASFILKKTATSMLIISTTDLRKHTPATAPGAGAGGGNVNSVAGFGTDGAIIIADGTGTDVQASTAAIDPITGVMSVPALGTGGPTEYDLIVGDPAGYGMMKLGNFRIGRTSMVGGGIDLDGAIVLSNIGGPATGDIEVAIAESTGGDARVLIPRSAAGLAMALIRSVVIAGPATATTDLVKLSHWQGLGLFHNLTFNTPVGGAELAVQGACEIEGVLYVDTITESTPAAGVTIEGVLLKDGALQSPVLTTPQINDTSADHQYVFAVNELAADRVVTLPLLISNDTFVFRTHIQTLINKTLTSPLVSGLQIYDTSLDHKYTIGVSELSANAVVSLPITGSDTFVLANLAQTLSAKTLRAAILESPNLLDTSEDHQYFITPSELTGNATVTLPVIAGADTFTFNATGATLTNKTIDADNNVISNLAHGSEVDEPSSGVHGVAGSVVGTSDAQTLTNKTIVAPNLVLDDSAAPTIDGAITFDSATNTLRLGDGASTGTFSNDAAQFNNLVEDLTPQLGADLDLNGFAIGPAGHIDLGDGTLRQLRPQTDEKMDLGSQSLRFNDAFLAGKLKAEGGVNTKLSTADVASPPTIGEINGAFGTAATVGGGFVGAIDDNGAGTTMWQVMSDGTNWFHSSNTTASGWLKAAA